MMAEKENILVVCVYNGARSQMTEEYIRLYGSDRFNVESAGLEPGELFPLVIRVLKEDGIDISGKKTRDIFDLYNEGRHYHHIITVCSEKAGERCPVFPGPTQRHHWPLPNLSAIRGSDEEILRRVRETREVIKKKVRAFLAGQGEPT